MGIKKNYFEELVARESMLWGDSAAEIYHNIATNDMDRLWDQLILPILSKYEIDYSTTVDFACGRGRNAKKLKEKSKQIILVDVNEENLSYCKDLFKGSKNIEFIPCNGFNLSNIEGESVTFFYTFDSMVHFDTEIIINYIIEISRILKSGGRGFIHHSNYSSAPGADFRSNPHWRNFMSKNLFAHICYRHGLLIDDQVVIPWGAEPELDCLTLCRKQ